MIKGIHLLQKHYTLLKVMVEETQIKKHYGISKEEVCFPRC